MLPQGRSWGWGGLKRVWGATICGLCIDSLEDELVAAARWADQPCGGLSCRHPPDSCEDRCDSIDSHV